MGGNCFKTFAHFIIVNEALQSVGAKHLVFCATNKVRALLRLLGVTCTEIALASSFVVENPLKWGSYYANQPTVCIVSLEQAQQQVLKQQHRTTTMSPTRKRVTDGYGRVAGGSGTPGTWPRSALSNSSAGRSRGGARRRGG